MLQPVKDELVDRGDKVPVLVAEPYHFCNFIGWHNGAGISAFVAGHLHLYALRMAVGLSLE